MERGEGGRDAAAGSVRWDGELGNKDERRMRRIPCGREEEK